MYLRNKIIHFAIFLIITLLMAATPQISQAASYKSLIKKGYKVSTLTRSRGGAGGWNLSNGQKRYFCKARVAVMYVGKTGMAILMSTTGRIMELDRSAYEKKHGGPLPIKGIPQLSDIKAGRIKPHHVRGCSPVR